MKILGCLLIIFLIFATQIKAGEFKEEFISAKLGNDIWKVTTAGKGSFEIKDSRLILLSPGVADGVMFYYAKKITNEDMFIEAKIDVSGIANDGSFGFTDEIIDPQINTDVHKHLNAQYVITTTGWGVNDDLRTKPEHKGRLMDGLFAKASGDHVFGVELKGKEILWSVDGKEVAKSERKAESRFFFISPDQYTTHYTGTVTVDYIKLSGASLSVSPSGSITTTWSHVKQK